MKQMIKKATVGVLATTMVFTIGATSILAVEPKYEKNFADADNDGFCDYAGNSYCYIDSDNDGICDNPNTGKCSKTGFGRNFVDADGDGVCDNYGTRQGRCFRGRRNK